LIMKSSAMRWIALAAATALVFAATVMVLMRVIPAPRRDQDYLIIGAMATLIALVAVFGGVAIIPSLRSSGRK
jgi:hypothetical protein